MITWIVLMLGFMTLSSQPISLPYDYDIGPQRYIMNMLEVQSQLSGNAQDEYIKDQQVEQEKIIIDWFFDRTARLGKIHYALGCVGNLTEGCSAKSFDCSGLLRYYGMWKGILEKGDGYRSSTDLFALGKIKNPTEAKRWDFIYFEAINPIDESWNVTHNHIGIVPKDYSGNWLWIMDNLNGTEESRELKSSCNPRECSYIWKYRIYVATNGFVELAKQKGVVVKKYIDDRSIIGYKIKAYLQKRRVGQFLDSFMSYGKMFNIKPEIAVCIANSETALGKNLLATWNIGNVQSHAHKAYVFDDGTPDWDSAIKGIYQAGLDGQYLINKQTVGDLYTNGDCKIDCDKAYAMWPNAQQNVLNCLSEIYNQTVGSDFSFRD